MDVNAVISSAFSPPRFNDGNCTRTCQTRNILHALSVETQPYTSYKHITLTKTFFSFKKATVGLYRAERCDTQYSYSYIHRFGLALSTTHAAQHNP